MLKVFPIRKPFTEQHKKNISIAKKGKPSNRKGAILSEETKKKISISNMGHMPSSMAFKKGHKVNIGVIRSKEWKERHSNSLKIANRLKYKINPNWNKGKNNPNWKHGLKPKSYPKEFSDSLRLKIRTRDNFTCCLCKRTEREELEELNYVLCVNHIDFNKNNNNEKNLNTLCRRCNVKINRNREYWTIYFTV